MPSPLDSIIGRCHVADSDLSVVRFAVSRLRNGRRTFLHEMSKAKRRKFMQLCIESHRYNQYVYKRFKF